jgi:diguanylate cyclase (GGDEF)-like protein
MLFNAVRQTLREALNAWPESDAESLTKGFESDPQAQARTSGFGCADALDRLHEARAHDVAQCTRLEHELVAAQAALAQARSALLGTEAEVRRARHLALHDSLTLLPNRNGLHQRLDATFALPRPIAPAVALLYLDLDGFKLINDSHGHAIGDELLRIVAARLVRAVRADDLVSRFGGDEFVCLLADMQDRDSLSHLACKLWDAVSAPVRLGRLTLVVRPSIGIALSPADGSTAEALLQAADAAMYRAKRTQTGYEFADVRAPLRGVPKAGDASACA